MESPLQGMMWNTASIVGSSFIDAGHTGTTTSISITGLTKYTEYGIRLRTLTANANSAWDLSVHDDSQFQHPLR